ncbi:MAG: hypothetical protein RIQ94_2291, partial [Pseudomonadota bacterium]
VSVMVSKEDTLGVDAAQKHQQEV